jgi:hypothetical protein
MKPKHYLLILFIAIICFRCEFHQWDDPRAPKISSCEKCHTDYDMLMAVFTPDTDAPAGGCGGEAPHYEPYDRVYMGGDGYLAFKQETHYQLGCTECHNGDGKSNKKDEAHSGDWISSPSMFAQDKCSDCHSDIVDNFETSLHNGFGQKRKVAIRSGFSGADDFDLLPAHQIEGYNKNCATCHASCGDCHTVRPPIAGGGLNKGHAFTKTPDMVGTCVSCHTSRGGHAYMGVASGTQPDVHLTKMGYTCLDCHTGDEMHGNGVKVEQRYAYTELPECQDCHTTSATSNTYHATHYDDFNCQVCHSQDYNNCASCHIGGEGARVPSYLGYKIAANPLPDVKPGFKFALVRRTLGAPDNWKEYGVAEYPGFDDLPTYNYTSPHNILRWTTRTQVASGASCAANCHIREEDGVIKNRGLYLFKENLLEWEVNATTPITVDEILPAGWAK